MNAAFEQFAKVALAKIVLLSETIAVMGFGIKSSVCLIPRRISRWWVLAVVLLSAFFVRSETHAAIVVDGTRDADYGPALAVQTCGTGYGAGSGGSSLANAYATNNGTFLYIFIGGNLETNWNKLAIFLDTKPGGQNKLSNTGGADFSYLQKLNGLEFDTGFTADALINVRWGGVDLFADVDLFGSESGAPTPTTTTIAAGAVSGSGSAKTANVSLPGAALAINNSAVNGPTSSGPGGSSNVTTGVEIKIPLSALGSPLGPIRISATIGNGLFPHLSNQFLAGLPLGSGNLADNKAAWNLKNYAGNQFFEVAAPPVIDIDGDGLPDGWEQSKFGNLNQSASGDPDGDSLSNLGEFTAGTEPNNPDTDGDQLNDGPEVLTHLTDPLAVDTDGDGYWDGAEVGGYSALGYATNPLKKNYAILMVSGDFLAPQWSDSPNAANTMMRLQGQEFSYRWVTRFPAPGNFKCKFIGNSFLDTVWGSSPTNGVAARPGQNIPVVVKASGMYVFNFNHDNTPTYSVERASASDLTYTEWARQFGLPAGSESADADNDGLTNAAEKAANTDPLNPDSDADGYTDKEEVSGTSSLGRVTDPLRKNYPSMVVARDFSVPPWNEAASDPYRMSLQPGDDFTWRVTKRFTQPATLWFKFLGGGTWTNSWGASSNAGKAELGQGNGNLGGTVPAAGFYTFTFNTDTLDYSLSRTVFSTYADYATAYGLAADSQSQDSDGDGRNNGQEWAANTDPLFADTDGDGVNDAAENTAGTDALQTNYNLTVMGEFQSEPWQPHPFPTNAPANVMTRGTGTNQFLHTIDLLMPQGDRTYKIAFANGKKWGACGQVTWFGSSTPGIAQEGGGDIFWNLPASGVWRISFDTQTRAYGFGRLSTNGLTYAQWAARYGLAENAETQNADYNDGSGDYLSNLDEYVANTDPLNPDTDRDGLYDDQEVNGDFNDVWKDGVRSTNAPSFNYNAATIPPTGIRLNPLSRDTDEDWLSDFFEVYYGLDPTDDGLKTENYRNFTGLALATTNANPNGRGGDPDGDGFTNLEEEWSGTSPIDPASQPVVRRLTFQVDMRQEMSKAVNPFNPASQVVEVRGEFNDWQGGTNWTLTNSATNGIYRGEFLVRAHTNHPKTFFENRILYKFYIGTTNTNSATVPGVGNEPYEDRYYGYEWTNGVAVTNKVLDVVVFGQNISRRNVTFTVDLTTQVAMGRFHPATDKVFVVGDAADWRQPADWITGVELAKDASYGSGSYFYSTTLEFLGPYDLDRNYKFRIETYEAGVRKSDIYEINDLYPESCGWQGARGFKLKGQGENFTFAETFNRWPSIPEARSVTFRVDMTVQALLGRFLPGSNKVYLAGDPTQGQPFLEMTRQNSSSNVYELTVDSLWGAAGTKMNYKFATDNLAVGNGGYEGDLNPDDNGDTWRQVVLGAAGTTTSLPEVFFNTVATAPPYRPVTFEVDMRLQQALKLFDPANHKVYLMGDVTDWRTGREMVRQGTDSTIYRLTLNLGGDAGISKRGFKFRFGNSSAPNGGWEGDVNLAADEDRRILTLGPAGVEQNTGPQMFNNDNRDVRNVIFAVDMSVQNFLGNFNPDTGKVYLVGDDVVGNWGTGREMTRQGATWIYTVEIPLAGAAGTLLSYKFKFGNTYEGDVNPASNEDRRILRLEAKDLDQPLPEVFFNNVSQARSLTFRVDMSVRARKGVFNTNTGTVYVAGSFNGWNPTATPMSAQGNGVYGAEVLVDGPLSGVQYKFLQEGEYESFATNRVITTVLPNLQASPLEPAYFNNDNGSDGMVPDGPGRYDVIAGSSLRPSFPNFTNWLGAGVTATPELLAQYAYGAVSPTNPVSRSNLPSGGISGSNLVMSFYVRKGATNPNLVAPQWHTNLALTSSWAIVSSNDIRSVATNVVDGVEVIQKQVSVPVDTNNARKFLRLKVAD